jgi:hypothetical protein
VDVPATLQDQPSAPATCPAALKIAWVDGANGASAQEKTSKSLSLKAATEPHAVVEAPSPSHSRLIHLRNVAANAAMHKMVIPLKSHAVKRHAQWIVRDIGNLLVSAPRLAAPVSKHQALSLINLLCMVGNRANGSMVNSRKSHATRALALRNARASGVLGVHARASANMALRTANQARTLMEP